MSDVFGPPCVAIDFETSGFAAHSACAVGLARIEDGHVAEQFYSLVRPPSSRVLFTEIHGLTWPMLKNAPTFGDVWPQMEAFMKGAEVLLAHNASFDRRVLLACCREAGADASGRHFLCTLKGARRSLPLPSKKLNHVCGHFGIALDHHHAGSDATACAEVYLHLRALGVTDSQMRI
ncbi:MULTISPECIES: 3'-5' exonuclease [unclassified Desulfovibrio]|uniref:3'-5' exonuclease n=1 Tax=unclassified Desulfovibrio TaxID=2593640 RepID=UPI002FDA960B